MRRESRAFSRVGRSVLVEVSVLWPYHFGNIDAREQSV